jgi:antitoxin ParD1/3/4
MRLRRNAMNFSLTPHFEAMIREKVESGRYTSSSEVVREALRLLEQRDREREEALRAALAVGIAASDRGDVVEWTPALHAKLFREGRDAALAGEQPKPDVCP